MKNKIQALFFDIDGVITDGKKYTDGKLQEVKSIAYKDLDAIKAFQSECIVVGCISGEDTIFSQNLAVNLDYKALGEKNKKKILERFSIEQQIDRENICYIGDGKYDIEVLEYAGLAVCPQDAVYEVKNVADIILDTSGGQGCIAELYTRIHQMQNAETETSRGEEDILEITAKRVRSHCEMSEQILKDNALLNTISAVCEKIVVSYQNNGQLFLCGNGGSAADAQHLAAELVGRFYLERQAYSAEALSTNTSIITALANDYDYSMIFARQIEAKGRAGDVLVGITTSGKSPNVLQALKRAKKQEMLTVLMSGKIDRNLMTLDYVDYVIEIPSDDTPRIQEGHILIGHIMCEIIESKLTEENEKNE